MAQEILILKHVDIEGPGTLEEFFKNSKWRVRVVNMFQEALAYEDLHEVKGIVSLGGPMNVYEEDKYPFLKNEDMLMKRALQEEIPVLGICLGAQILAKACRAGVKKMDHGEIGWSQVQLTPEGKKDPLFDNCPEVMDVFQWHEDTFDIPQEGRLLAQSAFCRNQAFRVGKNAYGFQFHVEVTAEIVGSWVESYVKKEVRGIAEAMMIVDSYKKRETYKRQADMVYLNFARIVDSAQKTGIF